MVWPAHPVGSLVFYSVPISLAAYLIWTVARAPVGKKGQRALLGILMPPGLAALLLGRLFGVDPAAKASPDPPPWADQAVMLMPAACAALVLLLVLVLKGGNRMRAAFYGGANLLFAVFAALAASMDIRAAYF